MSKRFRYAKVLCGLMISVFIMVMTVPMETYATEDTGIAEINYTVTGNVTNLTFSGASKATEGQDYTATISNNGGCQPPSAITVTVGGVQLSPGSSTYTYSVRNGAINIKGDVITGDIIISASATAHQWGTDDVVVVGPSCTQQGSKSKYCKVCGMTTGGSGIAATGHKFVNYVSNNDATCSKDGTKTATCSNAGCSATSTVTDTGSRLSHTSTGKRVNEVTATCMEEGYTGDLLCTCGAVVKYGEVIPVSGHSEMVIGTQKPSCIADGYTGDKVCRYCDTILAQGTVIAALEEHSYGEWTTVLEATALKIGRRERVCSMCGIKESELIPASEWGGLVLPLGIFVLIGVGAVGVGFGIYHAVKKINYRPNPMDAMSEKTVADGETEAIIVTPESALEENF